MSNERCKVFGTLGVFLLIAVAENYGKALSKREEKDDYYCSIRINGGLAEPQPLILCPDLRRRDFVYPVEPGAGHLVAVAGESFRIACPGSRLSIGKYNDTLVTCIGDNNFELGVAPKKESFAKLSCLKYPEHVARPTGERCGSGVSVEIGFPLSTKITKTKTREDFYRVIDLCHDESLGHTIFAHARIYAVIDSAQTSFPRTAFRKGKFFSGIQMQKVYERGFQRETLARILNSEKLAEEFIPKTGTSYLARGHLIAKSDFIYGAHQRTTFYYVNTVPMWQSVNAGNWGRMEANVRALASKRNLDLDVWVGGFGILTLKDSKGHDKEIYLHVDKDNKSSVPVPKVLFKVVYSYATSSGIVFLTANNPRLTKLTEEYRICKDVCAKIDYMTWEPNRAESGLSYCCEVDDFRRAFPNIPCLEVKRPLL